MAEVCTAHYDCGDCDRYYRDRTRAEAEQMANAQVAAFKERMLIEFTDNIRCAQPVSTVYDFLAALPADDSSLREHDAALLERFSKLVEKWREEWPLHRDMDYGYRIDAGAHHSCADELAAIIRSLSD